MIRVITVITVIVMTIILMIICNHDNSGYYDYADRDYHCYCNYVDDYDLTDNDFNCNFADTPERFKVYAYFLSSRNP